MVAGSTQSGSSSVWALSDSSPTKKEFTLDRILNSDEFATYLGITKGALYQLKHKGALPPAIRVGNTLRWKESTILAWMDQNTECPQ